MHTCILNARACRFGGADCTVGPMTWLQLRLDVTSDASTVRHRLAQGRLVALRDAIYYNGCSSTSCRGLVSQMTPLLLPRTYPFSQTPQPPHSSAFSPFISPPPHPTVPPGALCVPPRSLLLGHRLPSVPGHHHRGGVQRPAALQPREAAERATRLCHRPLLQLVLCFPCRLQPCEGEP